MSPAALYAFISLCNAISFSAHRREYDTPRHHQRLGIDCKEIWMVEVNMFVYVLCLITC